MQGHPPSLLPCDTKALRFDLTADGDFVFKLHDKGPKKQRKRGRKPRVKNKSGHNDSAIRKKRRRDKFSARYSSASSSEDTE